MRLDSEPSGDGKTLLRDRGATIAWTRPDMFSIEHRLTDMAQKKIDIRVLSVSAPNVYPWPATEQVEIARYVNDALARYCRAYPGKFIGLASLPLADVDASLRELDRAVNELGLKGVAIGSNIGGVALNDARFEPLWAKINALRLPVVEHPVFPRDTSDMGEFELPLRVGLMFDTTLMAARMIYAGIFERYPDFPFVLAHTGAALIMLMERLDNGYRLFPDCRKYHRQIAERICQAVLLRQLRVRRKGADVCDRRGRHRADFVRHRRSLHRRRYRPCDGIADLGWRQDGDPRRQRGATVRAWLAHLDPVHRGQDSVIIR